MRHLIITILIINTIVAFASAQDASIDRHQLVTRHNVHLSKANILEPLSVGNGRFCFTADVTGLQSFEADYAKGTTLATMADWGWHTYPNTDGFRLKDTFVEVGTYGRKVTYPIITNNEAARWLRSNPHRFSLVQISLVLKTADGSPVKLTDLENIDQNLDLWNGLITSKYKITAEPVKVLTCVHSELDAVAIRIESPLLADNRMAVSVAFAYPSADWGPTCNNWDAPERHQTRIIERNDNQWVLRRELDETRYMCAIAFTGALMRQTKPHHFELVSNNKTQVMELVVLITAGEQGELLAPSFEQTRKAAAKGMQEYWNSGGAIDLSASTDPRWKELERRIILSQYLMGIQNRGRYPPAETGLTCNSWHGKFHLEMHWWHSVHFALWGRTEVLERQLQWYLKVLPVMRATAERQGYEGVRWGKMLGADGREAPSGIGPLLIWQQSHPIYYAELLYRRGRKRQTLEKYRELVFETAEFMADFAHWNQERRCYELGPPVISAREFAARNYAQNKNPGFELAYWRWGLMTANQWRQRLGMEAHPKWRRIAENMAPLPINEGVYVEQESIPVKDGGHPCMLGSWGLLPKSPLVNEEVMMRTMEHVLNNWPRDLTWGWDYPLMAMTAARMGRGDWAVESLLLEAKKNTHLKNGHNYQRENLPCYLPGNGGLLTAAAMMAAGWDGGPDKDAPGFPDKKDGWVVRWEGLEKMP